MFFFKRTNITKFFLIRYWDLFIKMKYYKNINFMNSAFLDEKEIRKKYKKNNT